MVSMNTENDLRGFVKYLDGYIAAKFLPKVKERFQYLEQRCYVQAKGDEYKFADCMQTMTEKLLNEEKAISYRHQYLQQYLYECAATSQGNLETITKCTRYTKDMIDKSYENFFKNAF